MVDKFKIISDKVNKDIDNVVFFGFFKMDEHTSKWSIVCAFSELPKDGQRIFNQILEIVKSNLDSDELNLIARIGLFNEDHHLIQLFAKKLVGTKIESEQINGNYIHEGYVLYSKLSQ
jgi:hypothetical protein